MLHDCSKFAAYTENYRSKIMSFSLLVFSRIIDSNHFSVVYCRKRVRRSVVSMVPKLIYEIMNSGTHAQLQWFVIKVEGRAGQRPERG